MDNKTSHPIEAESIERNFKLLHGRHCKVNGHNGRSCARLPGYEDDSLDRGFNLLKWICNNEVVTRSFPEKDRLEAKCKTFEAEPNISSLLGMQSNVDNDTLEVCRGTDKEVPNKISQRAVLSFVASVFEPSGLFVPFTMRMRILLKTIWAKSRQQWDDKIDEEDEERFLDWVRELAEMKNMPLWRRYFDRSCKKTDLQIFSDTSLESMSIMAYL